MRLSRPLRTCVRCRRRTPKGEFRGHKFCAACRACDGLPRLAAAAARHAYRNWAFPNTSKNRATIAALFQKIGRCHWLRHSSGTYVVRPIRPDEPMSATNIVVVDKDRAHEDLTRREQTLASIVIGWTRSL